MTRAAVAATLAVAMVVAVVSSPAVADDAMRNPLAVAQPEAGGEALLLVEIPAGGTIKYETRGDGLLFVDRFLSMPVAYPANYGSLPGTLAGDGDPLDALVLTRVPVRPGALLRFRPIGVLRMRDGGETDEKIIGVPVDAVDPTYAAIRDIGDLPGIERERIEAFFRVYKALPTGGKAVELDGFGDAAEARGLLREAVRRFAAPRD